ncbi:hypothetical protein [Timonella sp. A28]|uniref:hypothetical protein n=1 Tax=Timonella sp. A28 TaxID=3442640 RepID=UPI003EB79217
MNDHDFGETFVEGEKLGVPALLDALTDVIERARSMPMSSSVLVNRNEALDLLDELREALPAQLTRADEVLSDASVVFEDAQAQAEDIIAAARERAQELISQQQIVAEARVRAQDLITQAEEAAVKLTAEADDYCDRRLAEFEIDLGKLLTQVQAGRSKLAQRLDEAPIA